MIGTAVGHAKPKNTPIRAANGPTTPASHPYQDKDERNIIRRNEVTGNNTMPAPPQ